MAPKKPDDTIKSGDTVKMTAVDPVTASPPAKGIDKPVTPQSTRVPPAAETTPLRQGDPGFTSGQRGSEVKPDKQPSSDGESGGAGKPGDYSAAAAEAITKAQKGDDHNSSLATIPKEAEVRK